MEAIVSGIQTQYHSSLSIFLWLTSASKLWHHRRSQSRRTLRSPPTSAFSLNGTSVSCRSFYLWRSGETIIKVLVKKISAIPSVYMCVCWWQISTTKRIYSQSRCICRCGRILLVPRHSRRHAIGHRHYDRHSYLLAAGCAPRISSARFGFS